MSILGTIKNEFDRRNKEGKRRRKGKTPDSSVSETMLYLLPL